MWMSEKKNEFPESDNFFYMYQSTWGPRPKDDSIKSETNHVERDKLQWFYIFLPVMSATFAVYY